MKIVFNTNQINERGTTTAILDYYDMAKEFASDLAISYKPNHKHNDNNVIQSLVSDYNLIHYENISQFKPDFVYNIYSGREEDAYLSNEHKVGNHAVFGYYNHTVDAHISEWLRDSVESNLPVVNHIVDFPKYDIDENRLTNLKKYIGIPEDAIVFGRYGGYDTFDIKFVHDVIRKFADNDRVFFLFANTKPFQTNQKNVIFYDTLIGKRNKANFINICDAMLHARTEGESFGLSICEFLYFNKPVISANFGRDRNHIKLLDGYGTLYDDSESLINIIENIKTIDKYKWSDIVVDFTPEQVSKQFKKAFLKDMI